MKKFLKSAGILAITLLPNAAFALTSPAASGLSTKSLSDSLSSIISAVLGLVGVIALAVILYGGFRWMTSGGNEEAVGEAKKIITAGVIGLILVIIGWAVVNFVLTTVV